MRYTKINGIILQNRASRELDRKISVFSYEMGKITVLAKGVRKITSNRSFHLDLLNEVTMELEESLKRSAGPLYLREVYVKESFQKLKKISSSFLAACIVAAFLERIIPEGVPQKALFVLTQKTFHTLSFETNPKDTLRAYFLKMLALLGYLPRSIAPRDRGQILWRTIVHLDPQFALTARRTLEIFSS